MFRPSRQGTIGYPDCNKHHHMRLRIIITQILSIATIARITPIATVIADIMEIRIIPIIVIDAETLSLSLE